MLCLAPGEGPGEHGKTDTGGTPPLKHLHDQCLQCSSVGAALSLAAPRTLGLPVALAIAWLDPDDRHPILSRLSAYASRAPPPSA